MVFNNAHNLFKIHVHYYTLLQCMSDKIKKFSRMVRDFIDRFKIGASNEQDTQ